MSAIRLSRIRRRRAPAPRRPPRPPVPRRLPACRAGHSSRLPIYRRQGVDQPPYRASLPLSSASLSRRSWRAVLSWRTAWYAGFRGGRYVARQCTQAPNQMFMMRPLSPLAPPLSAPWQTTLNRSIPQFGGVATFLASGRRARNRRWNSAGGVALQRLAGPKPSGHHPRHLRVRRRRHGANTMPTSSLANRTSASPVDTRAQFLHQHHRQQAVNLLAALCEDACWGPFAPAARRGRRAGATSPV